MKSLFKSWRKKDSKPSSKLVPPSPSVMDSQGSVVVEGSHQWSSSSQTSSKSSASSTPQPIQVPLLRLEPSASSSNDTFSSSLEDPFRYTPDRLSPDYPSHHSPASQRHYDGRTPTSSSFAARRTATPLNTGHGPPRNAKHGPPNVLQNQLSSINLRGELRPSHQSSTLFPSTTDVASSSKARTIKFDSSVPTAPLRVSRLSLSESKRPAELQASKAQPRPDRTGGYPDATHDDCRPPRDGKKLSTSTEKAPEGLKLYHSSQSSPHLPERSDRRQQDQQDLSSLFPSPPPLIIRKKVPQPLVLKPRTPPGPRPSTGGADRSNSAWPPSPNCSSTDSTPVSTPTSPRQFSSNTPTQTLLLKASFSRHGNGIPPPLYDPPTSPLPSPPVSPTPKQIAPRQPTSSVQGRSHLRGAMSTSNLKHFGYNATPTHRTTVSDPTTESVQQPAMNKRTPHLNPNDDPYGQAGLRNGADTSQEVQWGYAI